VRASSLKLAADQHFVRQHTSGAFLRPSTVLAVTILLAPVPAQAQGWDPAPLQSSTPVPRDGLPARRKAFFAWLSQNASRLSQNEVQRVHERVYAYISQLAKQNAGRFPASGDSAAFGLFRAAASLGITGADRVARALYPRPAELPAPAPVPGFNLTLRPPLFALSSDDASWGVCFPYYFMTAPAGRQTSSKTGVRTEVAILSTLFAADRGPAGSSQATVILAAAPLADSAKHVATWLSQFGLEPGPAPAEGGDGAWYTSPAAEPMHRLAVIRRLPTRVLVVIYLGLPGTFETNRPHFFNLLATVTPGQCAA
jgi:hypothetical protein